MFFGDEIARGRVPYVDFNALYGPWLVEAFSLGYRALGADWSAALWMLEVVSPLLCLALAYGVARSALNDARMRLVLLVAVALVGLDRLYWTSALRVWLPLLALALAQWALRKNRPRPLIAAAALVGACPWISPETAAALVAALAVVASRHRIAPRVLVSCAAAASVPGILYAATHRSLTLGYLRAAADMGALANWCFGLPLPPSPGVLAAFVWAAPFVAVALGVLSGEWPLSVYCAVVLRTALGRSDYAHLLFCLPPVFLLWTRLCERRLPARSAALVAALGLAPFVLSSALDADGELGRLARLAAWQARGSPGLSDWPEEGLQAPPEMVSRLRAVSHEIRRRVPPDGEVLSLPLPLYAHLARRPNALTAGSAELAIFGRGGPAGAAAEIGARRAPLLVVDAALRVPMARLDALDAAASDDPLRARLTWATQADEAVWREMRARLRADYAADGTTAGVRFYSRRGVPVKPGPDAPTRAVAAPRTLLLGRGYAIALDGVRGRQLRLDLRCAYAPGLSSLAKTFAIVGYVEESGIARTAPIPIPPASLSRDVRIPLPDAPLKAALIEVVTAGRLTPSPSVITLDSLRVVAR